MDNEFTREDVDFLLAQPDNSIYKAEQLRKIGLITTAYKSELVTEQEKLDLCNKPLKGFEFGCLYPHVHKSFDIIPEIIFEKNDRPYIMRNTEEYKKMYFKQAEFYRDKIREYLNKNG